MKKNNLGGMPPPTTRLEFEHNIFLSIEEVKYKVENDIKDYGLYHSVVPSLRKVKSLPNHRIDMTTIDEKARLHANMQKWMESIQFKDLNKEKEESSEQNMSPEIE
ncbi:hypothetical protein [Flavobacterium sp. KACC 22763]|uniref:hypothetical protein n=1 Tax=Flavobacterium sp. KACC 22763 TaxID=3025668 RepID=UPI00236523FF|nr:hypothetical protein [Flavobacterium sp. KACC 22763]WDF66124.1 hypothetical protein PQ463_08145 [Flavobacterium sp. KACC 22763]